MALVVAMKIFLYVPTGKTCKLWWCLQLWIRYNCTRAMDFLHGIHESIVTVPAHKRHTNCKTPSRSSSVFCCTNPTLKHFSNLQQLIVNQHILSHLSIPWPKWPPETFPQIAASGSLQWSRDSKQKHQVEGGLSLGEVSSIEEAL